MGSVRYSADEIVEIGGGDRAAGLRKLFEMSKRKPLDEHFVVRPEGGAIVSRELSDRIAAAGLCLTPILRGPDSFGYSVTFRIAP